MKGKGEELEVRGKNGEIEGDEELEGREVERKEEVDLIRGERKGKLVVKERKLIGGREIHV